MTMSWNDEAKRGTHIFFPYRMRDPTEDRSLEMRDHVEWTRYKTRFLRPRMGCGTGIWDICLDVRGGMGIVYRHVLSRQLIVTRLRN
jgi:hypothetical protein